MCNLTPQLLTHLAPTSGWAAFSHSLGFRPRSEASTTPTTRVPGASIPSTTRVPGASTTPSTRVPGASSDTARVSQREPDEHDGRVLHLVGTIYAAFRQAARSDEGVVLPELGELESVFERASRRRAPDEPAPAPQPG